MNCEKRPANLQGFVTCHWSFLTRYCPWALVPLVFLAVSPTIADDLTLKDGRKISGTIVGFENGMFRLETEFGYVLVRKDKVTSINMAEGAAKENPQKADGNKAANGVLVGTAGKGDASRSDSADSPPDRTSGSNARSNIVSLPAPPPVSRLLNEPLPAHIAEHEEGTNYFNDTFHFAMYKPPGWKIYDELPRGKVSAIVALASEDEQTLLFVDRQVWSGTPDLKNDSVEANLRQIYLEYKKISESDTQIDGHPAIRRNFSGVMDGVEWHGVAVRVAQGSIVYGIVEMTSAETFQFQEAVFNKIVKSFHFLGAGSEATEVPHASRTP